MIKTFILIWPAQKERANTLKNMQTIHQRQQSGEEMTWLSRNHAVGQASRLSPIIHFRLETMRLAVGPVRTHG